MKSYRGNQTLRTVLRALGADRRGQIALMFALSSVTIVTGVGAGVDLMRAYLVQQKLTHVATLTCQYASVQSVQATSLTSYLGVGSLLTFTTNVNNFLVSTWGTQGVSYPQLTPNPLTTLPTGQTAISVSASVPTTFMKIINVSTIPVSAASDCYAPQGPKTQQQIAPILQEGFESTPCGKGAVCYIAPNGSTSANNKVAASPSSFSPNNAGYVGSSGTKWYITGYCLETDGVGLISATVPEGQTAAELDCDNGYGTGGNSAISTNVFLEIGNYELRYWYRARADYPDYDPAYICGSSAADTSWANNTNNKFPTPAGDTRTNQINAYLDPPTSNGAPPFHTTLDGSEQLAGSNLIDTCVYSLTWIERSVRVKVSKAGYYWLTFAADGANDSFGGQIDDIRLCQGNCNGSPQDNFPVSWLPVNNGGSNKVLFQDTFSLPVAIANTSYGVATQGNLNSDVGSSGSALSGWPLATAAPWATAPIDQSTIGVIGGAGLLQYAEVAGQPANGAKSGRMIARPMLLVPGYYQLDYYYNSNFVFTGVPGTYCGATPAAATFTTVAYANGLIRNQVSPSYYQNGDINGLGVFIASGQLVSTPNVGGSVNAVTTYTNPDSNLNNTPPQTATSTTPTVPMDAISLQNYSPSSVSALLDMCKFEQSATWIPRTAVFEVQKPGIYWLAFSSQFTTPTTLGTGAGIDNVRVSALGSPAMLSPPSNAVLVPAPGVASGTAVADATSAFSIVADPLTFPAP